MVGNEATAQTRPEGSELMLNSKISMAILEHCMLMLQGRGRKDCHNYSSGDDLVLTWGLNLERGVSLSPVEIGKANV